MTIQFQSLLTVVSGNPLLIKPWLLTSPASCQPQATTTIFCLCDLLFHYRIRPVSPKGNQSWILIGRTVVEAEAPILWPPDAKSQLTGKDPDAGQNWRQEEKGAAEDGMVGWHHRFNGHELGQTPGDNKDRKAWFVPGHGVRVRHALATEQQYVNFHVWLLISKLFENSFRFIEKLKRHTENSHISYVLWWMFWNFMYFMYFNSFQSLFLFEAWIAPSFASRNPHKLPSFFFWWHVYELKCNVFLW